MDDPESKLYTFYESPYFMEQVERYASLDLVLAIQDELLKQPDRGDVIPGAHGARKARIGDTASGRGKRGGYRYLYLYLEIHGLIFLLYLYPKTKVENLSPAQVKMMAATVDRIKEALK